MSIDFAKLKEQAHVVQNLLEMLPPIIAQLAVLAPNAAGLQKANMVVAALLAIEPQLAPFEPLIRLIITGLVGVLRSQGSIPKSDKSDASTAPTIGIAATNSAS